MSEPLQCRHFGAADRAALRRAARAVEPTKAELRQIFDDQSGYINDQQVMWWSDFQAAARAILARWAPSPISGKD